MKAGRIAFPSVVLGATQLLRQKWMPVLVAAITFSMIAAVGLAFVERKIDMIETKLSAASKMTRDDLEAEIDAQVLKLGSMDASVLLSSQDFRLSAAQRVDAKTVDKSQVGVIYVASAGPMILALFFADLLIAFIAAIFFLRLFSSGSSSAYETMMRLPFLLLPFVGLVFWMLLRSFLWIPLLGIPIALYVLPRLSLAPVFVAAGSYGPLVAVRESMKRTKRRWAQLFLAWLGVTLTGLLSLWVLLVLTSVIVLFSAKIGLFVWMCSLLIVLAFFCACAVMITAFLA